MREIQIFEVFMNLQVELDKINLRIEETQKEIGVAQDALIDVDEGKTKENAKAAAKPQDFESDKDIKEVERVYVDYKVETWLKTQERLPTTSTQTTRPRQKPNTAINPRHASLEIMIPES